jgi:hypothetical protein
MTPARLVIARFGGVRPLARLMGLAPGTVCRWALPKQQRGSDGLIPVRHHLKLLGLAKVHDKSLTLEELCFGNSEI